MPKRRDIGVLFATAWLLLSLLQPCGPQDGKRPPTTGPRARPRRTWERWSIFLNSEMHRCDFVRAPLLAGKRRGGEAGHPMGGMGHIGSVKTST